MKFLARLFVIFLCCQTAFIGSMAFAAPGDNTVLMVSFDGFRSDYVERWNLANFRKVIAQGSVADSLLPSYPSKTFPNHYTLVTGQYPGTHGLVDNSFYAPELDATYSMGNRTAVENSAFYGGLPLWQHVINQGLVSASYFWVGSEAPVSGSYPSLWKKYEGSIPDSERVTTVLDWLNLPSGERPSFITLYFSLVDSAAHTYGPLSEETRKSALVADALVGQLVEGLSKLPIDVDLVIVSDHGMLELPADPAIGLALDTINLPQTGIRIVNGQTQVHLYSKDESLLESWIKEHQEQAQHFRIIRRNDTPQEWHYRDNVHIGDVLLVAEAGYVFTASMSALSFNSTGVVGVHGYDPTNEKDLHGIFYAMGPHVATGMNTGTVANVDVAPFVARLLQIPPIPGAESDGGPLLAIIRP
jgi:predicted AlkP superfamily pyrophosphatase or phosphodiesterase